MPNNKYGFTRREFLGGVAGSFLLLPSVSAVPRNKIFWATSIPGNPFPRKIGSNRHAGIECLLQGMGKEGLKFYRSRHVTGLSGPAGLIARDDVVLIKVNSQWKYRGCTNSDVLRGVIQRILEHPDGYSGEVVVIDNGQGYGSMSSNNTYAYPDAGVHANANNPNHSFQYLVDNVFKDRRVSCFLLDPIRGVFLDGNDHSTNGYRRFEDVSYPCFTTAGGRRVELYDGVWVGTKFSSKLKLINIPVLKDHGGSEMTCCLKHTYGLLSMSDGYSTQRHYYDLGSACGKMIGIVRPPVLNIVDAIWVSHLGHHGYPQAATRRINQLLASQDSVALDYWAAKYILYPIDSSPRHHPNSAVIDSWLAAAQNMINSRGRLNRPSQGIFIHEVTRVESEMQTFRYNTMDWLRSL